jgi:LPS export ABC transporter permease LptF/LPS export ABC transporter permease LptG
VPKKVHFYVLREITPAFFVSLLVISLAFLLDAAFRLAQVSIERGVGVGSMLLILALSVPSVVELSLPMACLAGVMIGLARLSVDSEVAAMQSLGYDPRRLLGPLLAAAACLSALTFLLAAFWAPQANARAGRLLVEAVLSRVEPGIKPMRFSEVVPGTVLFAREVGEGGELGGVFLHEQKADGRREVVVARSAAVRVDRTGRRVRFELSDGSVLRGDPTELDSCSLTRFSRLEESLDMPAVLTPDSAGEKGAREMTLPELMKAERSVSLALASRAGGEGGNSPERSGLLRKLRFYRLESHKRFALPALCFVFCLLGLGLGLLAGRRGGLAGFALSVVVIVALNFALIMGEKYAVEGRLRPAAAMWGPGLVLAGLAALLLLVSGPNGPAARLRSRVRRRPAGAGSRTLGTGGRRAKPAALGAVAFPAALDRYVIRKFLTVLAVVLPGLLAGAAAATAFATLGDVLARGRPLGLLFAYVWHRTPGLLYFVLPPAVLAAAVMALGLLARFNEVTAMKAIGMSLYRLVAPVLAASALCCGVAYLFQENIIPAADARAQAVLDVVNDTQPRASRLSGRQWLYVPGSETIVRYDYFDSRSRTLLGLSAFELDLAAGGVSGLGYAPRAGLEGTNVAPERGRRLRFPPDESGALVWEGTGEWNLEAPAGAFEDVREQAVFMKYGRLRRHIAEVRKMGLKPAGLETDLHSRTALPLAGLVMALLAVPAAFSIGRRGVLAGVVASVFLAAFYWAAVLLLRRLGHAGVLPPFLAAWAADMFFGLAGVVLISKLRT